MKTIFSYKCNVGVFSNQQQNENIFSQWRGVTISAVKMYHAMKAESINK